MIILEEWTDEIQCELYDIHGQYQGSWMIGFLPYSNQFVFMRSLDEEINRDNQGNIKTN